MPRRHGQKLGLTEIRDARSQTPAVDDTHSFLLEESLARRGASRQSLSSQNDRDCPTKKLQTEGVSITFKYLALRPLAIIEPSKSLLRDLLPHVLKMEIHFWYKLFVHCVENDFESTSWGSILHLINSLPVQFMWKIILNQQSSEEAQYMSAPNQFTLTFTWDMWNMQPWTRWSGWRAAQAARIALHLQESFTKSLSSLSSSSSSYSHLEVHHDMQGRRPRESSRLVD